MNRGEGDEGEEGVGEVLIVLGEATIAAEPGESSLDDPSSRQHDEALGVVGSLDDFELQGGKLGDGFGDLAGVVAAVGPDKFEPGEARAYLVEHEGGAVPILNAGRVNDDPQRQALDVDERVDLAALDLLASVVAYAAVMTTPFSADFTDWLSMIAAVGLAWRPIGSRIAICRCSQIACQTPSR